MNPSIWAIDVLRLSVRDRVTGLGLAPSGGRTCVVTASRSSSLCHAVGGAAGRCRCRHRAGRRRTGRWIACSIEDGERGTDQPAARTRSAPDRSDLAVQRRWLTRASPNVTLVADGVARPCPSRVLVERDLVDGHGGAARRR